MVRIMKELRIDSKGKRLEYSFIHNGMVSSFDTEEKAIKELMRLNNRKKNTKGVFMNKESICCSTLEQAKSCGNPECKLRQQLFDKIKKLLGG